MLFDDLARCRPSHVHGDVAAADHDHFLADGELVAKVDVEQEVNSLMHSVKVDAGDTEVATAMRADGHQHRVEALLPQVGNHEVASGGVIQLQSDIASFQNLAHLGFNHVARQAIFRYAQVQHSSRDRRCFEDRD